MRSRNWCRALYAGVGRAVGVEVNVILEISVYLGVGVGGIVSNRSTQWRKNRKKEK